MTTTHHLMIDVETFALSPNAFVWEVGVLQFQIDAATDDVAAWCGEPQRFIIDPLRDHADKISPGTVQWTREQHPDDQLVQRICDIAEQGRSHANTVALLDVVDHILHNIVSVKEFHGHLSRMFRKSAPEFGNANSFIWAKNAAFDFPILENMLKSQSIPWHRRQQSCLYTAKNMALSMGWKPAPREENNHSAVDDCLNQVDELLEIYRFFRWVRR